LIYFRHYDGIPGMRKSSERHPLAVLRRIIKMSQPEFAKMVGLSESTIAKIESLRLSLSPENALLIQEQTGCSANWLSAGDPKAPPAAFVPTPEDRGEVKEYHKFDFHPFTLETFQWVRSRRQAGLPVEPDEDPKEFVVAECIQEILRACHKAKKDGKRSYAQVKLYQLASEFVSDLGSTDPWEDDFLEYQVRVLDSSLHLTSIDRTPMD
jgi:transcriptional regulator with XRE-family HTH domain